MWTGLRPALATALLGVALVFTAWGFDAEPLWVPAVAVLVAAAGATLWVAVAATRVRVTRTIATRRVIEGEQAAVRIEVRSGGFPLPGGEVHDSALPDVVELRSGGPGVRIDAKPAFERRGVHRLPRSSVVLRDPLGLAALPVTRMHEDDEVLVLPRIEPVRITEGGQEPGAPRPGQVSGFAATELDGVRPLRDGTPASRVYWPAVARGADPMERRFVADGDGRPLVVLDPRTPASEEDLDAAVRATASLAVHLARQTGCWLLLPGSRRAVALEPTLGGWDALHARLAVVQAHGAPALADHVGRRGSIILVSALRRERAPALRHGAGARVLVVPGALPGRRAAFAVAGCHGYAIGRPARRVTTGAPA
ncbi:MAG: DUF58 domain-containing protein [Solirubrobacteraceae bacterium]|nr:DUF58 domain-containing protein [Solirubrobacteraceae bacterium]